MKGLLLILYVVCVAFVYSQRPSPNCPPYDENTVGPIMVRSPCNCSEYYVCMPPSSMVMPCPPGLQFNETKQQCDWPWNVRCQPVAGC